MNQPSTIDSLGLAGWQPRDLPAAGATLGSLAAVLGDFAPVTLLRVAVPAQRVAPLVEATRG